MAPAPKRPRLLSGLDLDNLISAPRPRTRIPIYDTKFHPLDAVLRPGHRPRAGGTSTRAVRIDVVEAEDETDGTYHQGHAVPVPRRRRRSQRVKEAGIVRCYTFSSEVMEVLETLEREARVEKEQLQAVSEDRKRKSRSEVRNKSRRFPRKRPVVVEEDEEESDWHCIMAEIPHTDDESDGEIMVQQPYLTADRRPRYIFSDSEEDDSDEEQQRQSVGEADGSEASECSGHLSTPTDTSLLSTTPLTVELLSKSQQMKATSAVEDRAYGFERQSALNETEPIESANGTSRQQIITQKDGSPHETPEEARPSLNSGDFDEMKSAVFSDVDDIHMRSDNLDIHEAPQPKHRDDADDKVQDLSGPMNDHSELTPWVKLKNVSSLLLTWTQQPPKEGSLSSQGSAANGVQDSPDAVVRGMDDCNKTADNTVNSPGHQLMREQATQSRAPSSSLPSVGQSKPGFGMGWTAINKQSRNWTEEY